MTALVLALPSKGRLRPLTESRFERAGMAVVEAGPDRSYDRALAGMESVRLRLAEPSSIPGVLARGEAHAGITGTDLASEQLADRDSVLEAPLPLGFGCARIMVAVPECWIDVDDLSDFEDVAFDFQRIHGRRLRVSTGFPRLARDFLTRRCNAGIEIVKSRGPTEAAPLAGFSEAIVDIVDTGDTLRANRLKPVEGGMILHTEACLWVSRKAKWNDSAQLALARLKRRLA